MALGDDSTVDEERRLRPVVLVVLATVVIGGAIDLYVDGPDAGLSVHMLVEATLLIVSAVAGIVLWRAWRRTATTLAATERTLTASQVERQAWQSRAEQALHGLAGAIGDQFDRWQLTPAEREVALLLLKGHGHKQIAYRTGRSESTVRQHAVAVYGKSGQGGRAELAAFFLEGLMLPVGGSAPAGTQ